MAKGKTMRVRMLTSMATQDGRAYNEGNEYDVEAGMGQEWIDRGFAIKVGD